MAYPMQNNHWDSDISTPFEKKEKKSYPTKAYIDALSKRLLGPYGGDAIAYLTGRGITLDAIHHFHLGLDKRESGYWLAIPYFQNGEPVNVKFRSLPPLTKDFDRHDGGKTTLFNMDGLKDLPADTEVMITEGEIDCMSMWCNGFKACVSTSLGAGAFQPAWVDTLDKFSKLYFIYDSDKDGREGAKKHGDRFDPQKAYDVVLPVKDVNEFFCSGNDADDMNNLLNQAKTFEIDNILSMDQVHENLLRMIDKAVEGRIKPQWPTVAHLTGAYEPGDLIVVTANPKIGKTTWALNDCVAWAKKDIPVLFYCLEMRPERLLKKVYQMHTHREDHEISSLVAFRAHQELTGLPLAFGYNYRKCNLEAVTNTIRRGVRKYGFEVVVFDNLHFLARSLTHQTQELGQISKGFKLLAEELNIPIIMIAQPNRGQDADAVKGINDLKGSSDIGADADQVIALWRKKKKSQAESSVLAEESFESKMLVRVDASRFRPGGETLIYYEGQYATVRELKEGDK
jgi:KaiC/GvpD/RAD55 family RecA-like ATPase